MSRESLPWSGSHPAVASSHPGAPNVFLLFPALPALLNRHMPYRPDSPHFPDKSAVQKQYLFHHHKPVRLPFYPPENLFIKNQSEKNWKNEQSISLGIKNSGQFSASSKISATLFENGYEPEKIKIEYSLGLFYKKKWFTGSISLKDHITCEF